MKKSLKIGVVNQYNEKWYERCLKGESSRSHVWGMDVLMERGHEVRQIQIEDGSFWSRLGSLLNRWTRSRVANFVCDFAVIRHGNNFDVIYISFGDVFLAMLLRRLGLIRSKLVIWKYEKPRKESFPRSVFSGLYNLLFHGMDGVCCLTQKAERGYRERYPTVQAKFIEWGADLEYLHPGPEPGDYYLSTGVTRRDLKTLLLAAKETPYRFVIVGPEDLEDLAGRNVEYIARRKGVHPHDTLTDQRLHELYQGARAILVPLFDIDDDTSGLTNIVEGFASQKPVVKTDAGSLDLDLEKMGVGLQTRPGKTDDWVQAFAMLQDDDTVRKMGKAGRKAAEDHFNSDRFGADVAKFLESL